MPTGKNELNVRNPGLKNVLYFGIEYTANGYDGVSL